MRILNYINLFSYSVQLIILHQKISALRKTGTDNVFNRNKNIGGLFWCPRNLDSTCFGTKSFAVWHELWEYT